MQSLEGPPSHSDCRSVEDPTEKSFPALSGTVEIEDAETGKTFILKTGKSFRERFKSEWVKRKEARDKIFASIGLDHIDLETGTPYIDALIRFFKMRERRFR